MRKMTFLACAALLTSAFVLGSCNKNDQNEPKAQMPEVKTQFSIALPNQLSGNGANRMPSATVQTSGMAEFQGMKDITLVPFMEQAEIVGTNKRIGTNITTANGTAMAVSKSDIDTKPSQAKSFNDVAIPLTTGSFLFYATSARDNSDAAAKFDAGALTAKNLTNDQPKDFRFCLQQILPDQSSILSAGKGLQLINYLNHVAAATADDKAWSTYTELQNQALHDMFATYTSIHGLSSFEVARIMTDLYKSLMNTSSPIANDIKSRIDNDTYADVDGSGNVTLKSTLLNWPQDDLNLPEGSIDIKWNGSNAFVGGDYANMAQPNTYVFPAQLWYFANSQIKTSNSSKQTMYNTTNDWATILSAHGDGTAVSARTRAVAVTDPIQYAVARLDVQVRLDAETLKDNTKEVEGATANDDINCAGGFPITAVLVGGQQDAKFDFTTFGATDISGIASYTIYDKMMTASGMKAAKNGDAYSAVNSTLVLENGTSDVMIAVEMLNDKKDFYGAGNQLIPLNSKFYVVAKLVAADATATSGHVFKQDYTTTAKLTLKNLKTAYNTIPDLRTPQLELGFSVDLTWQSGHTYEIDFQ